MKIIIIGAGPGGYETALLAAKRGIEVILIESGPLGGTCLNEGCIPTKAFCRNAETLERLKGSTEFGIKNLNFDFDFKHVIERKNSIVEQLRAGIEGLLKNKHITLVRGKAFFKDHHSVIVYPAGREENYQTIEEYTADYIIVATGSVSASLPIPGAETPGIMTSREILDIDTIPESICIIGGGVIGLEFASIFCSFGSKVTVLEYCKEILPHFDTDLSKRLKQALSKRGIEIITQAQVTDINNEEGTYRTSYIRKGNDEKILSDKVLMAVGRRANLSSLNFEEIGIDISRNGVTVNDFMQTNIPHIYAIGDINGKMMLAHTAIFQGIVALDHIMGVNNQIDLSVMPAAVFTYPEAASVGMTEEKCKEEGIPFRCYKSFFRANGKAVTMGETDGFCKILAAEDRNDDMEGSEITSGRILGCHMYGPHSSDIIQEMCALITQKATVDDLKNIIHAHPTLTEVLQSAVH